jgi:hypothetical protein
VSKITVVKATLSTGKVVLLRTVTIRDTEYAAAAVANRANGDANLLQLFMQRELLKNLIVKVDDRELSPTEKEDLDSIFNMGEYTQLLTVVKKVSGGDEKNEPAIEVVSSGAK